MGYGPGPCTAASGSYSATYTGAIDGELSGSYSVEILKRSEFPSSPGQYYTTYLRLAKSDPLTSSHGHLGYVCMKMVGSGACLTAALIKSYFYDSLTAFIPGVAKDDEVALFGNTLALYEDVAVGTVGQLLDDAPIVNTAVYGEDVTIRMRSLTYSSSGALLSSTPSDHEVAGSMPSGKLVFGGGECASCHS